MRADLLEAQASVDWAVEQLLPFHQRLEANVVIEIRDVPPPATHNPIVAVERELLPISFSVEAGAYINAIRSSLDILAMALVRRTVSRSQNSRCISLLRRMNKPCFATGALRY
jgi:hypothetical protein